MRVCSVASQALRPWRAMDEIDVRVRRYRSVCGRAPDDRCWVLCDASAQPSCNSACDADNRAARDTPGVEDSNNKDPRPAHHGHRYRLSLDFGFRLDFRSRGGRSENCCVGRTASIVLRIESYPRGVGGKLGACEVPAVCPAARVDC